MTLETILAEILSRGWFLQQISQWEPSEWLNYTWSCVATCAPEGMYLEGARGRGNSLIEALQNLRENMDKTIFTERRFPQASQPYLIEELKTKKIAIDSIFSSLIKPAEPLKRRI